LDLLGIRHLHFSLCLLHLLVSCLVLNQLVVNFLGEVRDLFVLSVKVLLLRSFLLLLFDLNLIFEVLDVRLVLVTFLLFDQDLIGLDNLGDGLVLLNGVFVNNLEDAEHTILST